MDSLDKLTEIFKKFPGIGPRQAKRFVYHILQENDEDIAELINSISSVKKSVSLCDKCYRYFENKNKERVVPCPICTNSGRDHSTLMIVVKDIDLQAMERSRAYNGLYFVLGNTVPILEEEPHKKIRQAELLYRIDELGSNVNPNSTDQKLKEIIVATSVNTEGEHTAFYLNTLLKAYIEKYGFKITTLGRGLSTGTELEYSDGDTLKSALENRH